MRLSLQGLPWTSLHTICRRDIHKNAVRSENRQNETINICCDNKLQPSIITNRKLEDQ
jgi:hypothetical protein